MSLPTAPHINFNGELRKRDEPLFIFDSRLTRFGDGFFETIRLMNGKLNFMERHHRRIKHGIQILQLEPEESFTSSFIETEIQRLIEKNELTKNARIRLTCFRSGGGLYEPAVNKMGYMIEMSGMELNEYRLNDHGLVIDVFEDATKTTGEFANVKSCNALVSVLASNWKKKNDLDESIVLNAFGRLSEGTNSNLFIVRKNEVFTPSLDEGCVAGVMRDVVLEICRDHQIRTHESQFTKGDLINADEIFFTNCSMGIRWCAQYRTKKYSPTLSVRLVEYLNDFISR